MNRERTSYVLQFSCWILGQPLHIGKVGRASWSIVAYEDEIQILRNDNSEKVFFDIATVCYSDDGEASQEFRSAETLNRGEGFMFFSFRGVTPFRVCNGYQGTVKVYSNSLRVLDNANRQNENAAADNNANGNGCCSLSEVSNDLLYLLDNSEYFSDAILKCDDTEIPVHKCILFARSPVFAAMFKNEMQEGREGIVEIVDMQPDVLRAMLRHVYSGKDDHLDDRLAEELLFSADKYQMEGLKKACVNLLKSQMGRENVFRYLVLGDMHDAVLKNSAIEYLCNCCHFSRMEKSDEWNMLREERPALAMDVLTSIIKRVQEKWHAPTELGVEYGQPQPAAPLENRQMQQEPLQDGQRFGRVFL